LLQGRALQPPASIPSGALDPSRVDSIHPSADSRASQGCTQSSDPVPSRLLRSDRRGRSGEFHLSAYLPIGIRSDVLMIRRRDAWAPIPILHRLLVRWGDGRGLLLLLTLRLKVTLIRGEQVVVVRAGRIPPKSPHRGLSGKPTVPLPKGRITASLHLSTVHLHGRVVPRVIPFTPSVLRVRMTLHLISSFFGQDRQPVQGPGTLPELLLLLLLLKLVMLVEMRPVLGPVSSHIPSRVVMPHPRADDG